MKKRPLRLLFVSRDQFPPFRVDVSVLFGKEIVRKGHIIDWILQSQERCRTVKKQNWSGGVAWVGPTNNGKTFLNRALKHFLRFFHASLHTKLLWRHQYDFIIVKDSFFSAIIYNIMSKYHGYKFIYWLSYPVAEAQLYAIKERTARYPFFYFIRGNLYKIILYKLLLNNSDHIFVQSEQMKHDISFKGIIKEKMTAIEMGFDPDLLKMQILKNDNSISTPNHKSIVYLGTLIRLRRIDFVIRVLDLVLKEIPRAKLYLIGKGESEEDMEFLRNEAQKLGVLNSIVFTGFLERNKALQTVSSSDVCISPFYPTPILNSTSPTKLIEYMAFGKPVVANDHPEQKAIIQKSGGGICVPYLESEFASAIIFLLKNPDLIKKMGRQGQEWVFSNRTYPIIADKVENALIRCLNHEQ